MDKCTTVQATQSRFDWLEEFHQNTEGVGPCLRVEVTQKFGDVQVGDDQVDEDDWDAIKGFNVSWHVIVRIMECLSFVNLPLPLVRSSIQRILNYIHSPSVLPHLSIIDQKHTQSFRSHSNMSVYWCLRAVVSHRFRRIHCFIMNTTRVIPSNSNTKTTEIVPFSGFSSECGSII